LLVVVVLNFVPPLIHCEWKKLNSRPS